MELSPKYPTIEHERAAETVVDFFSQFPEVAAINLTCSCARGKASRDSCLDMAMLVQPETTAAQRQTLEQRWSQFYEQETAFKALKQVGRYSHVDLDIIDGRFVPPPHGWTSGPDAFEVEIGNYLVYNATLWKNGGYLDRLKAKWLPYYDEALRRERLAMVRKYCFNNLDHIPLYVDRGLYFQSFDRFYNAFREFLQALFISRCTYPLCYDKWIREQIEEFLGLPELYRQLPRLFELQSFESQELKHKARTLEALFNEYVVE
jgi:predicted nucleotidyltransferase